MTEHTERPDDELVDEAEKARRLSAAARLFDVRRVIGGLFVVYGLLVGAIGLFDSPADLAKAQGVRINLWMGLGMLAVGGLFLLWLRLSPTEPPAEVSAEEAAARGRPTE